MARPGRRATGGVVVDTRGKVPRYGIRFRDQYGRRRYESLGAVSEAEASDALETRLAEVKIDRYRPPEPPPVVEEPRGEQTFHEFASEWLAAREAEGLKAKTLVDLHWSLEVHLLPYFAGYRLSEITRQLVDAYKVAKVAERAELEEQLARWATAEPAKRGARPPRGLSKGS